MGQIVVSKNTSKCVYLATNYIRGVVMETSEVSWVKTKTYVRVRENIKQEWTLEARTTHANVRYCGQMVNRNREWWMMWCLVAWLRTTRRLCILNSTTWHTINIMIYDSRERTMWSTNRKHNVTRLTTYDLKCDLEMCSVLKVDITEFSKLNKSVVTRQKSFESWTFCRSAIHV